MAAEVVPEGVVQEVDSAVEAVVHQEVAADSEAVEEVVVGNFLTCCTRANFHNRIQRRQRSWWILEEYRKHKLKVINVPISISFIYCIAHYLVSVQRTVMILSRRLSGFRAPAKQLRLSSNYNKPSPPLLPPEEQREFEKLQKDAQTVTLSDDNNDMHKDTVREARRTEFEGEVNPQTGEVGGPKREPLRWQGEWTYGGRATDF